MAYPQWLALKGTKMSEILNDLYELVERRKAEKEEGSYTSYLFEEGLDKILKKLGEECSETIIAAKNFEACEGEIDGSREAVTNESSDLIYHLIVMLSELGVRPEEVEDILRTRMQKTGNLKQPHKTDKNT